MTNHNYPKFFIKLLKNAKGKRAKIVIDHILKHGQITTQELKDLYNYNHPPRAIRDVKEQGIPIKKLSVTGSDGRRIAAYKFGDPSEVRATQISGRTAFSLRLKLLLIKKYGVRCNIYLEPFPVQELQIDHRIPFEITGDSSELADDVNEYMLLSASANRAKSWSCENCPNWVSKKLESCKTCYWAYPEAYSHIAMRDIRRLDLLWAGEEIDEYETLIKEVKGAKEDASEYVKSVLRNHFKKS